MKKIFNLDICIIFLLRVSDGSSSTILRYFKNKGRYRKMKNKCNEEQDRIISGINTQCRQDIIIIFLRQKTYDKNFMSGKSKDNDRA